MTIPSATGRNSNHGLEAYEQVATDPAHAGKVIVSTSAGRIRTEIPVEFEGHRVVFHHSVPNKEEPVKIHSDDTRVIVQNFKNELIKKFGEERLPSIFPSAEQKKSVEKGLSPKILRQVFRRVNADNSRLMDALDLSTSHDAPRTEENDPSVDNSRHIDALDLNASHGEQRIGEEDLSGLVAEMSDAGTIKDEGIGGTWRDVGDAPVPKDQIEKNPLLQGDALILHDYRFMQLDEKKLTGHALKAHQMKMRQFEKEHPFLAQYKKVSSSEINSNMTKLQKNISTRVNF